MVMDSEKIVEILKKYNLKCTNQRKLVISIVNQLNEDATIKNIVQKCNEISDSSTIYRIIDLFMEKGIFEKNINYKKEIYYSIKEEHGHYIRCVKCHKKQKINICPLKEIENTLEKEGSKIINHTIQLDVICKNCIGN